MRINFSVEMVELHVDYQMHLSVKLCDAVIGLNYFFPLDFIHMLHSRILFLEDLLIEELICLLGKNFISSQIMPKRLMLYCGLVLSWSLGGNVSLQVPVKHTRTDQICLKIHELNVTVTKLRKTPDHMSAFNSWKY